MITKKESLALLENMKYDEDMIMGSPARQRRNDILDQIIRIVNATSDTSSVSFSPPRPRMIDPDCPSGVCGSGGRV